MQVLLVPKEPKAPLVCQEKRVGKVIPEDQDTREKLEHWGTKERKGRKEREDMWGSKDRQETVGQSVPPVGKAGEETKVCWIHI